MKVNIKTLILIVFSLLTFGCSHRLHQQSSLNEIDWQPEKTYAIQQFLVGQNKEKRFQIQSLIELKPNYLKMIFLSEHGQRIASIVEKESEMHIEVSPFIPDKFDPSVITLAFKMVYWPLNSWKKNSQYEVEYNANRKQRNFYENGELKTTVSYEQDCPLNGKVHFVDHQYNYSLKIQSQLLSHDQQHPPCEIH